jgi:hypothetical protein
VVRVFFPEKKETKSSRTTQSAPRLSDMNQRGEAYKLFENLIHLNKDFATFI